MKNVDFGFYQQWTDLFKTCRWYDFTVINLHFEIDTTFQSHEFHIGFLGFTMSVIWYQKGLDDEQQ